MAGIPILDVNATEGLVGIGNIPDSAPVAAFQSEQIENLIQTKGIDAYHYRAAYAPERESVIAGVNVNSESANAFGVLFYEVRKLKLVPYSLKMRDQLQVDGVYGAGSCVLNVAGNYSDGKQERVFISPRDLFVLNPTITTQNKEIIEWPLGTTLKVKYRVLGVDYMATASTRYEQNSDFVVCSDGCIEWVNTANMPKQGEVVSLVYWFSPVYVVNDVPHSLRLLPSNPQGSGALPRELKYAPQHVICVQSHISDHKIDFSNLPTYTER
jgi:hypothetical protein